MDPAGVQFMMYVVGGFIGLGVVGAFFQHRALHQRKK